MTQEANTSSLRIEIFGQVFNLACASRDPDYILKLAEYVDSRMRALAETNTVDNFRLAVLAALHIADECQLLKTKPEDEERERSGDEVRLMTEEDRQRARERRQRHHTRRWYEKQLLAIANGELNPTKEQHKALLAFGRTRSWNRRPPGQTSLSPNHFRRFRFGHHIGVAGANCLLHSAAREHPRLRNGVRATAPSI